MLLPRLGWGGLDFSLLWRALLPMVELSDICLCAAMIELSILLT
jgi:hypothetical protein